MTLPDWSPASSNRPSGDTSAHTTRATYGEAASATRRACPCPPAHAIASLVDTVLRVRVAMRLEFLPTRQH